MNQVEPEFTKSAYFVNEPGNWHLKPGAPENVKKEFDRFMQALQPPDIEVDIIDL